MRSASLLLVLMAGLASSPAWALKLYRFKVDGQVVVRDSIPADLARLGYEVIGKNGMVLEVVPPAPTEEQKRERRQQERAEKDRETQKASDLNLKQLYERPEDVERARLRKSDEVNSYIGLLEKRIEGLRSKLEPLHEQQAIATERGKPLPPGVEDEIRSLERGIVDGEKSITDRREELGRITRDYAEQYERVRILQLYPAGTPYSEVDFDRLDRELSKPQTSQ